MGMSTGCVGGRSGSVSQIVFSDGLSAVSVFIEPARGQTPPSLSHQGAVNILTRQQGSHIKSSVRLQKMHSPLVDMLKGTLRRGVASGVFRRDYDAAVRFGQEGLSIARTLGDRSIEVEATFGAPNRALRTRSTGR